MTASTRVAVLGSTGSIGTQTLDIVRAQPDRFSVVALAAGRSTSRLLEQTLEHRPELVVVGDAATATEVEALFASRPELGNVMVGHGDDGLAGAARLGDVVVNAVVGFAGLPATMAALEGGKRLALANKESLIAAGPIVQRVRHSPGAQLLPVDSEHCALHQCLRSGGQVHPSGDVDASEVDRLVLTASGGPFRGRAASELEAVTIDDALAHPTWQMGPKITVDSSTLVNKGLEVIEAHELFGVDYDDIDVVVHPQSIVHSMVAYRDGATIAQLSLPDMRLCIGYALAFPARLDLPFGAIDWTDLSRLDFEPPDMDAFGGLRLAFAAGRLGETAPAWFSAANEVAVAAFLDSRIRWIDIAEVIERTLDRWPGTPASSVEAVIDVDAESRVVAGEVLDELVAV